MIAALQSVMKRGWLLLILLVSWELLARTGALDPLFFPPPTKLASTLGKADVAVEVMSHVGRTMGRALFGFGGGVLLGAALCIPLGLFPRLRTAAQPVIAGLYSTPRVTLLPMVILIFGPNEVSRMLLIVLSTVLIMIIQLADAIRNVNPAYVDMAKNYGAGGAMTIRKVYLPACLPQLFTALRLSFGRALVLTITLEVIGSPDGLGRMIWLAWQTFSIERLYIGVFLAGTLGLLCQVPFALLERRYVPWAGQRA